MVIVYTVTLISDELDFVTDFYLIVVWGLPEYHKIILSDWYVHLALLRTMELGMDKMRIIPDLDAWCYFLINATLIVTCGSDTSLTGKFTEDDHTIATNKAHHNWVCVIWSGLRIARYERWDSCASSIWYHLII